MNKESKSQELFAWSKGNKGKVSIVKQDEVFKSGPHKGELIYKVFKGSEYLILNRDQAEKYLDD